MKCESCLKPMPGENAQFVGYRKTTRTFVPLCSKECRETWAAGVMVKPWRRRNADKSVNRSDNAEGGVKPKRKPSPSEIRRKLRPSERVVSKAIADRLDGIGVWNTRTQSGVVKTHSGHIMRLCREGTPDRVFNAGLNVWIEVKRPGETPTKEQAATIAELKANGSLAFVLDDPEDLAFILQGLRDHVGEVNLARTAIAIVQNRIDSDLAAARAERNKTT